MNTRKSKPKRLFDSKFYLGEALFKKRFVVLQIEMLRRNTKYIVEITIRKLIDNAVKIENLTTT